MTAVPPIQAPRFDKLLCMFQPLKGNDSRAAEGLQLGKTMALMFQPLKGNDSRAAPQLGPSWLYDGIVSTPQRK